MNKFTVIHIIVLMNLLVLAELANIGASGTLLTAVNEQNLSDTPEVAVFKSVQPEAGYLDEAVVVTIQIKNLGSSSIYSITITEPTFSTWVFDSTNRADITYVEIPGEETRILSYKLVPKVTGTFTIAPTIITFYDKPAVDTTRVKYTATSDTVAFSINEHPASSDTSEQTLIVLSTIMGVAAIFIGINTASLVLKKKGKAVA